MSGLWSGQPHSIKLDELEVICSVLDCGPEELLLREPDTVAPTAPAPTIDAAAVGDDAKQAPVVRPRAPAAAACRPHDPSPAADAHRQLRRLPRVGTLAVEPTLRRLLRVQSTESREAGERCGGCGRILNCSKGFCRLCWSEASRRARPGHGDSLIPMLGDSTATSCSSPTCSGPYDIASQRSFDHRSGYDVHPRGAEVRSNQQKVSVSIGFSKPAGISADSSVLRFSEWLEEALRQPHIALAMRTADRVAGAYGWSSRLRYDVGRGLIVALACRPPDELVPHSELGVLTTHLRVSVARVAAVLDEAGLLLDDRVDAIEFNWQRRLADVDPAIRRDALDWLARLRNRIQPTIETPKSRRDSQ